MKREKDILVKADAQKNDDDEVRNTLCRAGLDAGVIIVCFGRCAV